MDDWSKDGKPWSPEDEAKYNMLCDEMYDYYEYADASEKESEVEEEEFEPST